MGTDKLVTVIIPIYKPKPNVDEVISLKQCLKVLENYSIIFIGPENLNTKAYENICNDHITFKLIVFESFYFKDIAGYNKLMLSPDFYKKFLDYKYILIYQLDAYVFKDELVYWCRQNYDFIGAPNIPHENLPNEMQFLKGYLKFIKIFNALFKTKHQISNVGNGGFSLRKTKTCYYLLHLLKKQISSWGDHNEDGFFKYWGNLLYPLFRLPSDEIALAFSIEHSPRESLTKLGNGLPFGCHAFKRYGWETWEPFIN